MKSVRPRGSARGVSSSPRGIAHRTGLRMGVFILVSTAACGRADMPRVTGINRVSVHTTDFCETLNIITDETRVAAIVDFVNARSHGWGGLRDAAGTPVGLINVYLHDAHQTRHDGVAATFGVGAAFFERAIMSRPASQEEVAEFARLIGIPVSWVSDGVPPDSLASRDSIWSPGLGSGGGC